MSSFQSHITSLFFKVNRQLFIAHKNNTRLIRNMHEVRAYLGFKPLKTVIRKFQVDHIPVMQIRNNHKSADNRIILYVHGGGFIIGSSKSYLPYTGGLCKQANAEAMYVPDYRLAPEAPFPAGLDDVFSVWEHLCLKYPDKELVLAGDSAGGNLALALCVKARDLKMRLPSRVYLQSPWLDLTLSISTTVDRFAKRDPLLNRFFLERDFIPHYVGKGYSPDHPLISPLHADLKGLPPFYVQVGSKEVLLDDSRIFAKRAAEAGVKVMLEVGKGMFHVWPQIPFMPESKVARLRAARWLNVGLI